MKFNSIKLAFSLPHRMDYTASPRNRPERQVRAGEHPTGHAFF